MQVTFEGKKGKDARSKKNPQNKNRGPGGFCQLGLAQDKAGPTLSKELVMGCPGLPSLKASGVQSWISPWLSYLNKHRWWRRRKGEQKYGTNHEKLILSADTLK